MVAAPRKAKTKAKTKTKTKTKRRGTKDLSSRLRAYVSLPSVQFGESIRTRIPRTHGKNQHGSKKFSITEKPVESRLRRH